MNWKRWRNNAPYIVLLLILLFIPITVKNLYYIGTATSILINALLAVSLWFIMRTGQVTLGHAAFAAIGGYMSAAFVLSYGLNSWLGLAVALATAGMVAAIIGYITLRITGVYFIITTLALGEVIRIVFGMWKHPFGGLSGLMNLPPPDPLAIPGLLVVEFSSMPALYYLVLVFVLVAIAIMYRLDSSPIGRIFRGISQADNLAEHIGINIMKYKVLAFVIGSTCAGLAGVLYSYNTKVMLPNAFTMVQSAYYIVFVSVGGETNIVGPILGTVVLGIFSEFLRPIKDFEIIIYALLLIGIMLFFRAGLLGLAQTIGHHGATLFTIQLTRIKRTRIMGLFMLEGRGKR
jgi:branched-chain amino acid transport system permease protein